MTRGAFGSECAQVIIEPLLVKRRKQCFQRTRRLCTPKHTLVASMKSKAEHGSDESGMKDQGQPFRLHRFYFILAFLVARAR